MPRPMLPALILLISVIMLQETNLAAAGNTPPPQTILSPATVKKATYPKIVIYTVAWCPHCRELKEYLTSHNIPFMNKDVEVDPTAMEELTQKYKSQGVPVIVLGKDQEVLKGFSAETFEKASARVLANEKK